MKIFQICQNHDAIIVFLQSKNKKLQKKKAKQETEIHKPKRKPTSLNRNTQPEKGAQIPIRQNISTRKTRAKTNLKWKHNKENKIRDTKQKQQPENDM